MFLSASVLPFSSASVLSGETFPAFSAGRGVLLLPTVFIEIFWAAGPRGFVPLGDSSGAGELNSCFEIIPAVLDMSDKSDYLGI